MAVRAVIAQYYKTEKSAAKRCAENSRLWKGRVAWYVLCAKNGYFVISESVARSLYPNMDFPKTDRRYKKL